MVVAGVVAAYDMLMWLGAPGVSPDAPPAPKDPQLSLPGQAASGLLVAANSYPWCGRDDEKHEPSGVPAPNTPLPEMHDDNQVITIKTF